MEMLAYIAVVLAALVATILALAARRPDSFRVARTLNIAATPEQLFPLINDLKQMNTWNPYALRDPSGQIGYSGPASGPGARFDFGGKKSGTGHIEITEATPTSKVDLRLVMTKPFKADNAVAFTLTAKGRSTDVTWAMSGPQPLLAKCMAMVIDCDKMVGRDFEQGLANLKAIAEGAKA